MYDDYVNAYIDKLFYDYFTQNSEFDNYSLYLTASLDWNNKHLDYNDIKNLDINDIINNFDLTSLNSVIVIHSSKPLNKNEISKLYECYDKLTSIEFKYYNIQFLRVEKLSNKLEDMLSNIRTNYETDLFEYDKSVELYVSISQKDLTPTDLYNRLIER